MNTKGLFPIFAAFLLVFQINGFSIVTITDVQIVPETPSINDIITIETQGYIPGAQIRYDETIFTIDNYILQLNLYYTAQTGTTIPKPWSHLDEIGILPQGNYDLLVQTYWRNSEIGNYILHDDYSTSFQVVIPEPATLCLLVLGTVLVRSRR